MADMPNILDEILTQKKIEVAERKLKMPASTLEGRPSFQRKPLSLREYLMDPERTGIIAEFKRRSPSKGIINAAADVVQVTNAYSSWGASAISVLTDEKFFGGSNEDLEKARINEIPILRKDFTIDEYQLIEARAIGADAILLIAACLTPGEVRSLAAKARALQLEPLLEIHNQQELEHICDEIDLVGINNRDLKSFSVDVNRCIELFRQIPSGKICVAESGINEVKTIEQLKKLGFKGFLIGENFMKAPEPSIAFASFVKLLKPELHESKSLRHDAARTGQKAG